MVEIEDIKLFERAHEGKLGTDEMVRFEQRADTDKTFRVNYAKYQSIIAAIEEQQHYDSLRILLDDNYKSRNWLLSAEEEKSRKMGPVLLIAGTVILLLAIVTVFWIVSDSNDEMKQSTATVSEVQDEKQLGEADSNEGVAPERIDSVEQMLVADTEIVDNPLGSPTAFLISQQGYFLTQYSSVKGARSLRLRRSDSTDFKVQIVLTDSVLDLAVLQLADRNWPSTLRLPYRLATTRAAGGTEVMMVKYGLENNHVQSVIDSTNRETHYYSIGQNNIEGYAGSPVISKNGNIVAIVIDMDGRLQYVKSTLISGFLLRNASQLPDYRVAIDNRLAGLEREQQLQRMEPFVLEVVRFY